MMKADEIQDVLELQALLADHGCNEAAEDPEVLASLITWKYIDNGVVASPPPTKTMPPKPKPATKTRAPAPKPAAPVDDPDF